MFAPRALAALCTLALAGHARPAGADDAEVIAQVDAAFAHDAPKTGPGGVALLLRRGEVLARRAYGLANLELTVPMEPELRFRIASISKQITAVALLQLVDAGKVDLHAPLSRYLPGTPPAWSAIRIEHLLAHTSGIPSPGELPLETSIALLAKPTLAELRAVLAKQPLRSKPGVKHVYNNYGYDLLGEVIERVTGRGYCEYVTATLFQPLGMTRTVCPTTREPLDGLVTGYERDPAHRFATPAAYELGASANPAAGIVSTADDLGRWAVALYGGTLLSPASLTALTTPARLADGTQLDYAMGARVHVIDGHRIVEAGGEWPGYYSEVAYDADSGVIAISLSNFLLYNFQPPWAIFTRRLLAIGRGHPLPPLPRVVVPEAELAQWVGDYATKGSRTSQRAVQLDGGTLYSKELGDPGRDELVPLGNGLFAFGQDDDTRLQFTLAGGTAQVHVFRDGWEPRPGELTQLRLPRPPGK